MADATDRPPLTPLSMHVLLALAERDLHGYALIEAVRQQSGGTVDPGTGSLYTALQRMTDEGLLRVVEEGEGRRGSTYGLTDAGRAAARREASRLRQVLELAACRNLVGGTEGA